MSHTIDQLDRPTFRLLVQGAPTLVDVWPPETTEPIQAQGPAPRWAQAPQEDTSRTAAAFMLLPMLQR